MLRLTAEHHDAHLLSLLPSGMELETAEPSLQMLRQFGTVQAFPAMPHTARRRLRTLLLSSTPDMLLRGRAPRFETALRELVAREPFDVVQAESIEMAQYGRAWMADGGRQAASTLFCYDAFNAEYLLQRRAFLQDIRRPRTIPAAGYSLLQWGKLRRYERRLARGFDLILAVSELDRRILGRLAVGAKTALVPNGVDTAYFGGAEAPQAGNQGSPENQARYILFTGTLDFRPNVDALRWFVRDVWPRLHVRRPDLRFRVVGQRPTAAVRALASEAGVEIVGPVDDVRPWFAGASVYVLPMRVGGGVRLKLLEAWAMRVPCVTTTLGAEGVGEFRQGTHALVADTAAAFVTAVERILDDPALASDLASAGRRLVEERYDWRAVVARMEAAWHEHRLK